MRRELVVSIALIGSVAAAWAEDVENPEDLLPELAREGPGPKPRFAFSNHEVHPNGSSAGAPFTGSGLSLDNLVVGHASDGKSAWFSADATNSMLRGECTPEPCSGETGRYHAAGLAERVGKTWRWVAWHISEPVAALKQAALVKQGVVPDALPRSIAGAEAAVKVFEASIGDPKALAATVSDREEVALFGSAAGERAEEGAQVKARLLGWKLAFKVRDGIRAGVTASKNVAWVAANVDATSIKRPKDPPQPYRVLAIYEKTPAAWKLVQLSFSVDPRTDVKK
jgi:hypothetical protein